MEQILNSIRSLDYSAYYQLYSFSLANSFWGDTAYFFAKYGIVIFFLSFIYLILKRKINAFLCTLLAMGTAGVIDLLITLFWSRPRPYMTHHDLLTPALGELRVDPDSFPSVHTYIVFAIAISIFLYGHRRLGTALFILALLVAVGRVATGLHYPSDIIGGALLGLSAGIVSYIIISRWEKNWL